MADTPQAILDYAKGLAEDADPKKVAPTKEAPPLKPIQSYSPADFAKGNADAGVASVPQGEVTPPPGMQSRGKYHVTSEDDLQVSPPARPRPKEPVYSGLEGDIPDRLSAGAPKPNAPPPPAPPGAGTPLQSDISKKIEADYNARIDAMGEEGQARGAAADDQAGALGDAADQARDNAVEGEAQAHTAAGHEQQSRDEIQQLTNDYANGHIDENKWWSDKSVPGKIATVVGAMMAGATGGHAAVMDYMNNQINRSLSLQQEEINRKGKSAGMATNLLESLHRSSKDEAEALDRARALMLNSSMIEVQRAAAAAKGPMDQAQIKELIADMQLARDMALAPRPGTGTGSGAPNGMLSIDDAKVRKDPFGNSWAVPSSAAGQELDKVKEMHERFSTAIASANRLIQKRKSMSMMNPADLASMYLTLGPEADTVAAEFESASSKYTGARGIPQTMKDHSQMIAGDIRSLGSIFHPLSTTKLESSITQISGDLNNLVRTAYSEGGTPVDVVISGGHGKNVGQFTTYVKPRQADPNPAPKGQVPTAPKTLPEYAKPR